MTGLERPVVGLAVGAATIAIQSSSAMLGIVITLAGQGLLTLQAGLAVMLGAEIGTCADTLIASIGRTRAALRAGAFHLVFNIICAIVGVLLIDQLAALAKALPGDSLSRESLTRTWRSMFSESWYSSPSRAQSPGCWSEWCRMRKRRTLQVTYFRQVDASLRINDAISFA